MLINKSVPRERFYLCLELIGMEYKIYLTVCDIIDYLYKDNKEKYKKFYIKIIPKEMKSIHGRYTWDRSLIEIFNLSRPYNHTITTILHEVAHHIDYVDRGTTNHKREFYDVFYRLEQNGYIYNGYGIEKKSWNKKIKASELEREEELLSK